MTKGDIVLTPLPQADGRVKNRPALILREFPPYGDFLDLYAKVASHSLTALKTSSKCSFIPYKLRFLVSFRLVMKHDPTFAYASLVCGISTQIRQAVPFDDIIRHSDADFPETGLVAESLIRLGFLAILPRSNILGGIGTVAPERHAMLLRRLARHLIEKLPVNG